MELDSNQRHHPFQTGNSHICVERAAGKPERFRDIFVQHFAILAGNYPLPTQNAPSLSRNILI
jgi:hypothetical protein